MSKPLSYKEVKNFIEDNECKLLSNSYFNAHKPLIIQCKCGNLFETNFNKFKTQNKRKCNECVNLKRWSYEEIKNYIEDTSKSNCKLLSKEFNGNKTKLYILCKCGNVFIADFNKFKDQNKQQCNACGHKNAGEKCKISHRDFIKKVYELEGCNYSILSIYKTSNKKVIIKHNKCGYIYYVKPNNFITGYRCPRCAGNLKKNTEIFINEVSNKFPNDKYLVLSEYIRNNKYIKIKHNINSCEYEWVTRPSTFLNGKGCPKCSFIKATNNKKKDFEFIKQYIKLNNYILLTNHYDNAYQKLQLKCRKNHYIKISWRDFNRGVRCSICAESRGEQEIRYLLEKYNIEFKEQYSFIDLKDIDLLRFDFAIFTNKNLICLIEFDGIFHYKPVLGMKKFKYQIKHDNMKNEYCYNNNIRLIRIPYWELDNNNINNILKIENII
jgi:hypothetical protein